MIKFYLSVLSMDIDQNQGFTNNNKNTDCLCVGGAAYDGKCTFHSRTDSQYLLVNLKFWSMLRYTVSTFLVTNIQGGLEVKGQYRDVGDKPSIINV